MALPVESEKELSVGGFQGIKKLRGMLTNINVEDPPASWSKDSNKESKQVVKVDLEEVSVLEMFGDEEPFELKDGKFNFYIPYAVAGAKPHANSIYNKCWLESAKELGKKPSEFIGTMVTLEKQPRLLFEGYETDPTTKKPVLDANGQKIKTKVLAVNKAGLPNHFCFAGDVSANSGDVKAYIVGLVEGMNQKAALRKLLSDPKAKQYPDYRTKLNDGTLAEFLGLVLIDDLFQKQVV